MTVLAKGVWYVCNTLVMAAEYPNHCRIVGKVIGQLVKKVKQTNSQPKQYNDEFFAFFKLWKLKDSHRVKMLILQNGEEKANILKCAQ